MSTGCPILYKTTALPLGSFAVLERSVATSFLLPDGNEHMYKIDMVGRVYGYLTCLHFSHQVGRENYWVFSCKCGNTHTTKGNSVRQGVTTSCGCRKIEVAKKTHFKHGQTLIEQNGIRKASRLYRIWTGMKRRCTNPDIESYEHYGGRGIAVCQAWFNDFTLFEAWAHDNGYESHLSIERKNNDGDYSPSNCKWATQIEQANNKRSNRNITHEGVVQTLTELARKVGISPVTLAGRLDRNWALEDALLPPKSR